MKAADTGNTVHFGKNGVAYTALLVRKGLKIHLRDRNPGDFTTEDVALRYQAELRRRHVEFVTALVNGCNGCRTYDMRAVCTPSPESPHRSKIRMGLICRQEGKEAKSAGQHIVELLRLAETLFPEYMLGIADRRSIEDLLHPFPCRHLSAVVRRWDIMPLDSLRSGVMRRRKVGFQTSDAPQIVEEVLPDSQLFHVFPFRPCPTRRTELFSLMMRQGAPIATSVRLQPAVLSGPEEAFLEEQIVKCERFEQLNMMSTSGGALDATPSLKRQASAHQEMQTRVLCGLRDNAALMTVHVASSSPIPESVLEMYGNYLSMPAGSDAAQGVGDIPDFLAGGYDIVCQDDNVDAVEGFYGARPAPSSLQNVPPRANRLHHLFDSVEATCAFCFPPMLPKPPDGIIIQEHKTSPAMADFSERGCLLGVNRHGHSEQEVRISDEDRRRHMYVVGQTGTGKTTLLQSMVLEDILAGKGVCFIDPHGDAFHWVLDRLPAERIEDYVIINPVDAENPVGINLFECGGEQDRHYVAQELVAIIKKMVIDEYGGNASDFMGPVFSQHVRMNSLLVMSDPDFPGTMMDFYQIFTEKDRWKKWLPLKLREPLLDAWVEENLSRADYLRKSSEGLSMGEWIASKFHNFVFDPLLGAIFCQRRSTINFRNIMDEGRVVLVNLAKGQMSAENSKFLGLVILGKIMQAALERARVPADKRRDFSLYVDEFQSIATETFVSLLSEARKFGLSLVLANQFLSQVEKTRVMDAIYGNVGTHVAFRVGVSDAEFVESLLTPQFSREDLVNLPNWTAYVAMLVNNQRVKPFSVDTVLPDRPANDILCTKAILASEERHGAPEGVLNRDITSSRAKFPTERLKRVPLSHLDLPRELFDSLVQHSIRSVLDLLLCPLDRLLSAVGNSKEDASKVVQQLKELGLLVQGHLTDDRLDVIFPEKNLGRLMGQLDLDDAAEEEDT